MPLPAFGLHGWQGQITGRGCETGEPGELKICVLPCARILRVRRALGSGYAVRWRKGGMIIPRISAAVGLELSGPE